MSALKPWVANLPRASAFTRWLQPQTLTRLLPVFVLAIGLTALVMMFLWRDQSSYKPVFGAREQVPVSEMVAVLDAEGIAYRLHPETGQVLVSDGQLGRARMLLAAKGVTARLPEGLELMDKKDPLGVSQFVQDVRFRRGLEGELAQSIMSMDPVRSARVHLSIARSSTFVLNAQEKSSASVALALHPGRTLGTEQIASIIQLVSGSVSNLDPARVSVVDQSGRLLSARVDPTNGFDANALGNEATRQAQDEVRRNAHELLAPLLGDSNYRLSVSVELDQDRVQETHERYGEAPRVTNEATREELDRDRVALGVPGSLSNRPVAAPAANDPNASPGSEPNTAQRSATTRQYAYDRSVTTIQRSRGRVKQVNVAVMLNDAAAPAGAASWNAAELARMERVLRGGLGIQQERGDQLVISSMPFPKAAEPVEWWAERDNVVEMTRWGLYALGALLAYLLIARPLLRLLRDKVQRPLPAEPAELVALDEGAGHAAATAALTEPTRVTAALPGAADEADARGRNPVVPLLEDYDLPPPGSPVDVLVDHLKVLAGKEPERVAEVVKQWVQKNGRTA